MSDTEQIQAADFDTLIDEIELHKPDGPRVKASDLTTDYEVLRRSVWCKVEERDGELAIIPPNGDRVEAIPVKEIESNPVLVRRATKPTTLVKEIKVLEQTRLPEEPGRLRLVETLLYLYSDGSVRWKQ
jgi:hypothetical protein